MKSMGRLLLLVLLAARPAHALVEYDFDGISGRGAFTGYLSLDPDQSSHNPDMGLPYFLIPGSIAFTVGQTTYLGAPWQAAVTRGVVDLGELAAGNPVTSTNFNFWLTGDFADTDPDDLRSIRWDTARAPDQDLDMNTYGDEDTGGFWFRVQNFTYRRPSTELADARGGDPVRDADPVPEPASAVLLGSALAALAGYRRLRR